MEKKLKVTADEQQTTTTMSRATKPKELTKLLRPKARYGDFILGQESKTGNSESHEKYKKNKKIAREMRWEAEAEAEAWAELEHDIHVLLKERERERASRRGNEESGSNM